MSLKDSDENFYNSYLYKVSEFKNFQYGPSFRRLGFVVIILIMFQFYYNTIVVQKFEQRTDMPKPMLRTYPKGYKRNDTTTYLKFKEMMRNFEILGMDQLPKYTKDTPICLLDHSILGPITANKTKVKLEWVEQQLPNVKAGGFSAPENCRSRHKVAILVPFRNRETNLAIFLYHIHPFLKKQLLQYRIFVIEQYGTGKFNKGSLYNVGYLEIQRYGEWHCLFFHDVDLLPIDERILYSCPRSPTHLSASVESQGYQLPYYSLFGGVSVMTPAQYYTVNGYSNKYLNWGAEDDDMSVRLQASRFPILRYNATIGRYATLPHTPGVINYNRYHYYFTAKKRFREEGLRSMEYKLVNITTRKLFTHILADVNPYNAAIALK